MRAILSAHVEEMENKLSAADESHHEALEDLRRMQENERADKVSHHKLQEEVAQLREEKNAAEARAELANSRSLRLPNSTGAHDECDQALEEERARVHELEMSLEHLTSENRSAKKRVVELERASAAMELDLASKARKIEADSEELENLNIALDTKQHELEMVSTVNFDVIYLG